MRFFRKSLWLVLALFFMINCDNSNNLVKPDSKASNNLNKLSKLNNENEILKLPKGGAILTVFDTIQPQTRMPWSEKFRLKYGAWVSWEDSGTGKLDWVVSGKLYRIDSDSLILLDIISSERMVLYPGEYKTYTESEVYGYEGCRYKVRVTIKFYNSGDHTPCYEIGDEKELQL